MYIFYEKEVENLFFNNMKKYNFLKNTPQKMIPIFFIQVLNAFAQNIFVYEEMKKMHDEEYKKVWQPSSFNNMVHCFYKRYETFYNDAVKIKNDLADIQNTFSETGINKFHCILAEFKFSKKDFDNKNFGKLPLAFIEQVDARINKKKEKIRNYENLEIEYIYNEKICFEDPVIQMDEKFKNSFNENTDRNYVIIRIAYFLTDLMDGFFPKLVNIPFIEKNYIDGETNPIYFMFSMRFSNPIRFLFSLKYINESKLNLFKKNLGERFMKTTSEMNLPEIENYLQSKKIIEIKPNQHLVSYVTESKSLLKASTSKHLIAVDYLCANDVPISLQLRQEEFDFIKNMLERDSYLMTELSSDIFKIYIKIPNVIKKFLEMENIKEEIKEIGSFNMVNFMNSTELNFDINVVIEKNNNKFTLKYEIHNIKQRKGKTVDDKTGSIIITEIYETTPKEAYRLMYDWFRYFWFVENYDNFYLRKMPNEGENSFELFIENIKKMYADKYNPNYDLNSIEVQDLFRKELFS